jgi:hypothetical protein
LWFFFKYKTNQNESFDKKENLRVSIFAARFDPIVDDDVGVALELTLA